jgi:tRNA(Arg) A34 adenosine deaminase TadA
MPPTQTYQAELVIAALLKVADHIIPLLRQSVSEGNFPFGASILRKTDLTPITVSVNKFQESPILHGETNCIREFFLTPPKDRPDATECLFFATHEPCSMCLSAVAFNRFPVIYYLFTYEDTSEVFGSPLDLQITNALFGTKTASSRPHYNQKNEFWSACSVDDLLEEVKNDEERRRLKCEIQGVKQLYNEFSVAS